MKRGFFTAKATLFIICLLISNIFPTTSASSEEDTDIIAEPYLYEGDMSMSNGELEDAQEIYEFVLKQNPHSYEALWRLSRFYILRGMAVKRIKDKKRDWKKAEKYGRSAIDINSDGPEGHLYLAIAAGKLALFSAPAEKVKRVWEIKREAEKAIELDPRQQKAYLTLGAWHRNVAVASSLEKQFAKVFFGKLPAGNLEESLKFLLKSISLGGTNVRNYYELALTYEAMGDYETAKREYGNALSARLVYPEDIEIKERIKEALRKSRYN